MWVAECGRQGKHALNGAGWGWITHSSELVSYLLHPAPCSHEWAVSTGSLTSFLDQGKVPARVGWSGVGRRKRLEHVFLWVPFCWARVGSDLFLSPRPGLRSSSLLRAVGLTSLYSGFPLATLLGQRRFTSAPCLPHTLTHGLSCLQCTLRLHATPPTLPAALASDCVWQIVDPFHSCPNQNSPTLCWS